MIIAPGWAPFSLIIFTNFLVSILEMATVLLLIKNLFAKNRPRFFNISYLFSHD